MQRAKAYRIGPMDMVQPSRRETGEHQCAREIHATSVGPGHRKKIHSFWHLKFTKSGGRIGALAAHPIRVPVVVVVVVVVVIVVVFAM